MGGEAGPRGRWGERGVCERAGGVKRGEGADKAAEGAAAYLGGGGEGLRRTQKGIRWEAAAHLGGGGGLSGGEQRSRHDALGERAAPCAQDGAEDGRGHVGQRCAFVEGDDDGARGLCAGWGRAE